MTELAGEDIIPSLLTSATWTLVRLQCNWRFDDTDRFVAFTDFGGASSTNLSIAWVSATPKVARPWVHASCSPTLTSTTSPAAPIAGFDAVPIVTTGGPLYVNTSFSIDSNPPNYAESAAPGSHTIAVSCYSNDTADNACWDGGDLVAFEL